MRAAAALVLSIASAATAQPWHEHDQGEPVTRIAFGSCYEPERDDAVWDAINEATPDLFIFLGDNVYADTEDMGEMRAKYAKLFETPGVRELTRRSHVLATWDDHDFGVNDGGREYPKRNEAQRVFLDAFNEPEGSERRRTEGIYDAEVFGPPGKRVQVILLDTRYFRDPLDRLPERDRDFSDGFGGVYTPTSDTSRTMLGEAQWAWLADQLRVDADVRIVASSIQFVAQDHGWETWANMPHERERFIDLIERTGAGGVVFISGDRHKAEVSRLDPSDATDPPYPLYDVTASSLNKPSRWYNENNRHRLGAPYSGANFGLIEIDWSGDEPALSLTVRSDEGRTLLRYGAALSDLTAD